MAMQLYTDAGSCFIVNEGAEPPCAPGPGAPPQLQGRVHDIDFSDAQFRDIQAQISRNGYASVPGRSLSALLALLKASTTARPPGG